MTRPPLMRQTWRNLLFAHWPVPAALLRPYLPARLEVDTFEGQAWLGVVPFSMSGIRPLGLPTVPGLSQLHELNVRTYATLDGVPGVWFLSLDATNALGVWAARTFFHLPYLNADIIMGPSKAGFRMEARRTHAGAAPATFRAAWTPGAALPRARPGSLAHFLTERYRLFTAGADLRRGVAGNQIWQGQLAHAPWQLRTAELHEWESTLLESHGLPAPVGPPLLYAADATEVRILRFGRV